ncbi:hypothetical protein HSX10_17460 [Winogradskyella undariae]|uniref:hypothetical protein n=1 Tax=Winogradskyella undariae TaxID=1285465 RepID=UPI00156B2D02|nr:hypothetical protein [Winogradskyella undariae]NRR93365.1 hypothetical protein [Winogradskyella undariae]
MNIQFQEIKLNLNKYKFYIENKYLGEAYEFGIDVKDKEKRYNLYPEKEHLEQIMHYKISEFPKSVGKILCPFELSLDFDSSWILAPKSVDIQTSNIHFDKKISATIEIQADMDNWQKPYTLSSFAKQFKHLCENYEDITFVRFDFNFINNGFGISYNIDDAESTISIIYNKLVRIFSEITISAINHCVNEIKENSLTSIFKFPDEIKEPCQQYLIYFSKFLEDLGIQASTSIEQEAQSILFMVTPQDPSQALSKIRDALNIYLKLPEVPDLEKYSSDFNNISVHQLVSNIYHLKSQLLLSQSVIQAKDATIASLNFTNYQQQLLLSNSIENEKNEEKLLNNVVTIKELDGKGFSINLPELFRMLKRKFK